MDIKKFLPFENITYQSRLDSDQILSRLSKVVEPKKTFRMKGIFSSGDHKPYEGTIEGNTFSINRIINYRNSFLPRIEGTIEKDLRGSNVVVKMRLHAFIFIFAFFWLGAVGIGCMVVLFSLWNNEPIEPVAFVPFAMILFFYVLVTGAFKYESIKSKKYLAELFAAENEY